MAFTRQLRTLGIGFTAVMVLLCCAHVSYGKPRLKKKRATPSSSFGYDESIDFDISNFETKKKKTPKPKSPWQFGAGAGLNIPEIAPLEAWGLWNDILGLRVFFAPKLDFGIRVELPEDQVSSKNGLDISTPAMDINLDASYGPHVGMELMSFPFAGAFYVGGGVSYRSFQFEGIAKSPLIVRYAGQSIETYTKFGVDAFARTSGVLARLTCGWLWQHDGFYWQLGPFGLVLPKRLNREVKATGIIDAPGDEDADLLEALTDLQKAKEIEMEEKALKELEPGDSQILPIASFSVGFIF